VTASASYLTKYFLKKSRDLCIFWFFKNNPKSFFFRCQYYSSTNQDG